MFSGSPEENKSWQKVRYCSIDDLGLEYSALDVSEMEVGLKYLEALRPSLAMFPWIFLIHAQYSACLCVWYVMNAKLKKRSLFLCFVPLENVGKRSRRWEVAIFSRSLALALPKVIAFHSSNPPLDYDAYVREI
ncbi:hypothetical protein JTE90_015292 [Oedothorax gibbosus]|uniref:Uncharacterized protein n=1 Tax=Oedothorax gibbosus TaxID=931172 RepID=A0AAV6VNE6_9ARAC|nr:hypothetical protein JTE90_015292 [Oedothorax gibbosus]